MTYSAHEDAAHIFFLYERLKMKIFIQNSGFVQYEIFFKIKILLKTEILFEMKIFFKTEISSKMKALFESEILDGCITYERNLSTKENSSPAFKERVQYT